MSLTIPAKMFEVWRACDRERGVRQLGLTRVRIVSDGQKVTLTASDGTIIAYAAIAAAAEPLACYLHRDAAKLVARVSGMVEIKDGVVKSGDLSFATESYSGGFFPRNIDSFGFRPGRYWPGTGTHNTLFAIAKKAIVSNVFSSVRLGEISEFVGESAGVEFRFVVVSATKGEKR